MTRRACNFALYLDFFLLKGHYLSVRLIRPATLFEVIMQLGSLLNQDS
jgi:hypothetical protein